VLAKLNRLSSQDVVRYEIFGIEARRPVEDKQRPNEAQICNLRRQYSFNPHKATRLELLSYGLGLARAGKIRRSLERFHSSGGSLHADGREAQSV
jgi:hypothetical protein